MIKFGFDTRSISVITAPTSEPVTLDEAKQHCRVTSTFDDVYISGLITAARIHIETAQRRQLMTATLRYCLDNFPLADEIMLPRPPLRSVTSIIYIDTSGVTQTWDTSNYDVDTYNEPGRVALAWAKIWPVTRVVAKAVTITYAAGYADVASVPEPTKQWILSAVATMYFNRMTGTPTNLHDLGLINSMLEVGKWGDYP